MEALHQVEPHLKRLRLSGVLETLEMRHREAIQGQIGYLDFLTQLLLDEVERRNMKQLQMRLKRAGASSDMTMEAFDFSFNPALNRQQILDLGSCDFIQRKENVFFIGPSGVGKTHLACALAHEACRKGLDVLYVKTSQVIRHLNQSRADDSWKTRIESFLKPDLLILDDWGLKPFGRPAADDLYEVICERYEKGSLVLTKVRDKKVLKLIRRYLQAGIMKDGVVWDRDKGTPQGGPLSPLLSNIMLDAMDKELEKRGLSFCRYADDCNIYVASSGQGSG
jgi:DNA replication protein DnaC